MGLAYRTLPSIAAFSLIAAPAPASAQAQQTSTPDPPPSSPTITVTGERTAVESTIDRNSYNIANDLQGATGTVADVLRNVPSVQVDPDGNVSIRGDRNVVIMIDGRPAGMLRGADRGAALQQMPADQYERVEVITNPSAALGPEGSGGVINLIRKKARRAGLTGSARANVGMRDRVNGGVSGAYATARTTLSSEAGGRRDELTGLSDRVREVFSSTSGTFTGSRQDIRSVTETISRNLRAAIEQSIGNSSQLEAELSRNRIRTEAAVVEDFEAESSAYVRQSDNGFDFESSETRATLTRTLGDSQRKLTLDASRQRSNSDRRLVSEFAVTMPSDHRLFEQFDYGIDRRSLDLKAEYVGGPDHARLQFGYESEIQDNRFDSFGARGDSRDTLTPLADFNNRFDHEQTVHGFYGTHERTKGKMSFLAGLRFEHVELALTQHTDGSRFDRSYSGLYPTAHLAYDLSDKQQLKASFSRRVQRPQGQDLNPFLEYRDPLNVRAGNPELEPAITDSLELTWQRREGPSFTQAALYFRSLKKGFTDIVEDIGDGIFLSRKENLGRSRMIGLETIVNRRLTSTLTINTSVNVAWNEIAPGLPGFVSKRSGVSLGGRGTLSWQPSERDFLQISGFLTGRSIRPQGFREPSGMINAGYRRKLTAQLSAVMSIRDLLGNFGETVVYDTPQLRDRAVRRFGGRVIFVGLSYTLGRRERGQRENNFDFDAGRSE